MYEPAPSSKKLWKVIGIITVLLAITLVLTYDKIQEYFLGSFISFEEQEIKDSTLKPTGTRELDSNWFFWQPEIEHAYDFNDSVAHNAYYSAQTATPPQTGSADPGNDFEFEDFDPETSDIAGQNKNLIASEVFPEEPGTETLEAPALAPDVEPTSEPAENNVILDKNGNPFDPNNYEETAFERDFGDAPDPSYPTYYSNNGARHFSSSVWMGPTVDWDNDGQPVDGDDNADEGDDEDGLTFSGPMMMGSPYTMNLFISNSTSVHSGNKAYFSYWVDFNMNGAWESGEKVIDDYKVTYKGVHPLTFDIPMGQSGET
jgi:hypothetical protein